MNKLLKCKLCDYEAKQLFQHVKAKHNMTTEDYRSIFGNDIIMQINFNTKRTDTDEYRSNYVKNGYKKLNEKVKKIKNIYSKEKNIVIEYDEKRHFDKDGKLKNRDIVRQKEIEDHLGCQFIRINA